MNFKWSFRLSRWTLAWIAFLTISYIMSIIYPLWVPTFCFRPCSLMSSLKSFTPLTFSLVTDEHITQWLTVLAIVIMDKLVSDCWSKWETIIFILFVDIGSLFFSTLLLRLFVYSPETQILGNAALIAAVTVISAQFDSDRYLLGYGKVGLKSRHGFFCGLCLFFVLSIIQFVRWTSFLMFFTGFFVSWFYLRFLQHHPQRKYGDHRTSFALAKFFPGPLEPWVALPSNLIYTLVLRSRLCPGIERQSEIISTASFAVNIPGLTSDTERHRRLALRVLNERLMNDASGSKSSIADDSADWPDLSEPDSVPISRDRNAVFTTDSTPSVLIHLPQNPTPDPIGVGLGANKSEDATRTVDTILLSSSEMGQRNE